MTKNYKDLQTKYSTLFENFGRYGPVSCDEGWYDLIDNLCHAVSTHFPNVRVLQIKEKFGGLRFYTSSDDSNPTLLRELLAKAENASFDICEICGQPGKTCNYTPSYIRTVCAECLEKKEQTC